MTKRNARTGVKSEDLKFGETSSYFWRVEKLKLRALQSILNKIYTVS